MEKYDIEIDFAEAYRYMGCRGIPSGREKDDLEKAARMTIENSRPRVVYKICRIEHSDAVTLPGTCLRLEGKAIAALLHDCGMCVIFCATIGTDVDALIRKWQIKDIAFAAALDACASSAVENLCGKVEDKLTREYNSQGFYLTDRFSPGYGDLPLSIQKDFCAALDTSRKIGVSVTESGLMIPKKSVTAIIGISKNRQKHRDDGCGGCLLQNTCRFRESGVTCYGEII